VYVLGHSCITYHEKADKLAGDATVFGDLVLEPDEVIHEIEVRLNEQENASQQHCVNATTDRKGWTRGDRNKSVDSSWSRSLVNQVERGVLSRIILRRLIERGGPVYQPASLLLC
jgi:hypothetical protein